MDFSIIFENIGMYFGGLKTTLVLVALALVIGLACAIPLAVIRSSGNRFLSFPVQVYTYFFRGTPMLVQMFMIYYGMAQFEAVKASFLWPFFKDAWFCALVAFTLNTCAYTTEIIWGAIENTPHGEIEAAKAVGMSLGQRLRHVILPSAFRRALPSYSNEVIFMLHGSAIASTITIMDLTGVARQIYSRYYSPYEAFITAALFYLCTTFVIVFFVKRLEKRWYAHLAR